MASTYPSTLDSLATNKANGTLQNNDHPGHHNDLADAVNKIEAELGTNPSGASATVAARFSVLASSNTLFVNVQAHGAAGDGATNDTTAINTAIAALPASGGVLYFPAGTYLVTPINGGVFDVGDGVIVQGEGMKSTIIKSTNSPANPSRFFEITDGRVEFRDITISGPDSYGVVQNDLSGIAFDTGDGPHAYCERVRFLRLGVDIRTFSGDYQTVEVVNCEFDGDDIGLVAGPDDQNYAFGILHSSIGPVIVKGCHFHNKGSNTAVGLNQCHCIYLSHDTPLLCSDTRFESHIDGRYIQCFGDATGGPHPVPEFWTIQNCYFGEMQVDNQAVQTNDNTHSLIDNCTFTTNYTSILPKGNATIRGCLFKGGDTTFSQIIMATASSKVLLDACVFTSDTLLDVDIQANNCELSVTNCIWASASDIPINIGSSSTGTRVRVRNTLFDLAAGAEGVRVESGTCALLRVNDCEFRAGARGVRTNGGTTVTALHMRDNYFTGQTSSAVTKSGTVTAEDSKSNIGYADV